MNCWEFCLVGHESSAIDFASRNVAAADVGSARIAAGRDVVPPLFSSGPSLVQLRSRSWDCDRRYRPEWRFGPGEWLRQLRSVAENGLIGQLHTEGNTMLRAIERHLPRIRVKGGERPGHVAAIGRTNLAQVSSEKLTGIEAGHQIDDGSACRGQRSRPDAHRQGVGAVRKRHTSDQTTASNLSPLMEAPMHLPGKGPRSTMEPLQR